MLKLVFLPEIISRLPRHPSPVNSGVSCSRQFPLEGCLSSNCPMSDKDISVKYHDSEVKSNEKKWDLPFGWSEPYL